MGQAVSLTQCPSGARQVSYDDGSLYEICPKTIYIGPAYKTLNNVLSTYDCLFYCNQDPVCTRGSYKASDLTCSFSTTSTTTWYANNDFDTVHLVNKTVQAQPANNGLGQWSTVTVTPVIPVGAYVVPEYPSASRVMMYSSWNDNDFTTDSEAGTTQFAEYNFVTGNSTHRTVANTHHDMFCPGMSSLQDGRLMITGGNGANVTSFWDPVTHNFTLGPVMNIPRGYHSTAITSKGQVFTLGGSYSGGLGGKNGELFDPVANKWSLLSNVSVTPILTGDSGGIFRQDNHPWLYGWKDGSVFHGGPSVAQHWIDTSGNGNIVYAATRDTSDAMCGIHVMYDAVAGKILSAGGSPSYSGSDALKTAHVTTIGNPGSAPQIIRTGDLNHARAFANAVALPDGTVLVTGGQNHSQIFTDIASWYTAELWNPATGVFTELAPALIPRNYHSMGILLADGRVMVGGGGLCDTPINKPDFNCPRTDDHPDIEIFSPQYLFNKDRSLAPRPVISAVSSSSDTTGRTAIVGGKLSVTLSSSATSTFSLVRIGSVTHSTNTDQRRVPLANVQQAGSVFNIQLPNDAGIMIPGFYYLFALSQAGVPSIGQTVRIVLQ